MNGYQKAYSDLYGFFRNRDFSHRQGSGYVSNKKLISADIVDLTSLLNVPGDIDEDFEI